MRKSTRLALGGTAAFAALALAAGPASAYHCVNESRSAQGNASAATHSDSWLGIEEAISDPEIIGIDLCDAGVAAVLDGLEEAGFDPTLAINERTLMAQGLVKHLFDEEGNPIEEPVVIPEQLSNGKGVDHLDEEFFVTADALILAQLAPSGACYVPEV